MLEQPSFKSLTKKQQKRFIEYATSLEKSNINSEDIFKLSLEHSKRVFTKASKVIPIIKAHDDEEMVTVEVVYEPNVPDAHGQWMSCETVRKACEDFNTRLKEGKIKTNLFHSFETDTFSIQKSWINEVDCIIGDQLVPEGTWLCSLKYHNTELWKMHKSGEVGGVSIRANGAVLIKEEVTENEED